MSGFHPVKKLKRIRNKKLLLQVGLIVLTIFLVIMVATGWLVYRGGKKIYLQAKNEMIDRDLLRIRDNIRNINCLQWTLEYYEANTEKMDTALASGEPISDEESELVQKFYAAHGIFDPDKPVDDTELIKDLENESEEVRFAVAKSTYQLMLLNLYISQYQSHYDRMFIMDINEENRGFVFCCINVDDYEQFESGTTWDYPAEKHSAVETILTGKQGVDYDDTVYEQAPIGDDEKDYYIGYTPVIIDGKTCCVVCISFDYSEFIDALMPYIFAMFALGLVIMLLSAGVLLLFLHISAVHPLRKIQKGVRQYMQDKDSEAVVAAMGQIRSKNELGVLSDDIAELAEEFDRYTKENIQLASEKEKAAAELELASKIQSDMLPKRYPDSKLFDLYASMTPAKEVGGDFYDFFMIDEDHLGMVIADVSGKGVPASLYMMMSMIVIRNYARSGRPPAEVLRKANRSICEHSDDKMFVTVWFGVLEISTGHVVAANAGHEYPIIRKSDGAFELFKDTHSFVLGAMPGMKYREYEFEIGKGGTLFLYTDGAAEATDADENLFGTDRMIDALNKAADLSPKSLIDDMTAAINDFVGDAPQYDDLTMLCVRYNGGENAGKPVLDQ